MRAWGEPSINNVNIAGVSKQQAGNPNLNRVSMEPRITLTNAPTRSVPVGTGFSQFVAPHFGGTNHDKDMNEQDKPKNEKENKGDNEKGNESSEAKLIFFDYDWTLINHNYPDFYVKRAGYADELHMLLNKEKFNSIYEGDTPVPCMQWYVEKSAKEGKKCICLTHEIHNLRNELKKENIAKWYPDITEFYTVDAAEHKVDFMKAYADVHGIPVNSIEIVDDTISVINNAIKADMHGRTVTSIACEYDLR